MVDIYNALNRLKISPYGIIIAYIICVIVSYGAIWSLIEPLNIPESISDSRQLPKILMERSFLHVVASFVFAAFLTLLLDLMFRNQVIKMYKDLTLRKQAPIASKTLGEYDAAFDDLCKQLAFAIGRYQDHKRTPDKHDVKYAMDRVNEVRRARMRFLKVCGSDCRSLLIDAGTEWLRDLNSFAARAYEIETRLSTIVTQDRELREQAAMAVEEKKSP